MILLYQYRSIHHNKRITLTSDVNTSGIWVCGLQGICVLYSQFSVDLELSKKKKESLLKRKQTNGQVTKVKARATTEGDVPCDGKQEAGDVLSWKDVQAEIRFSQLLALPLVS